MSANEPFTYRPNYKNPIVETLEWRTDVMRSFSGKEQRRALRQSPRRGFEFGVQIKGFQTQKWQNLMWGWQSQSFCLPVWTDHTTLLSDVTPGASTISCNTAYRTFAPSSFLMFYSSASLFEVVEVLNVTAGVITLKAPTTKAWSAGDMVYPCVLAHLPSEVNVQRVTSDLLIANCTFATSPDNTFDNIPTTAAPTTYDGLEVVTVQPNWVNGLGQNLTDVFQQIDVGVGQIRWLERELNPSKLLPYSWLLNGREAIAEFRAFLGRQSGKLKTCWVPSWTDDFTAILQISAASKNFPVLENDFTRLVGINPAYDRIMIRTKSGLTFYRRITAFTQSGDGVNPALVLDSALGVALTASDILAIHMLHRCRFATDKFDLQWHTNGVVTIDSNFTTVDQ